MKIYRKRLYRKHWKLLIEMFGDMCYWCGSELAGCLDHVIPAVHGGSEEIDNIVPSCTLCNLLASDKLFDSEDDKRHYLLRMRKGRQRHYECSCCGIPFIKNEHLPSFLMCPVCYDHEYMDTVYSKSKRWVAWLADLDNAGFDVDAFACIRKLYQNGNRYTKQERREIYTKIMIDKILEG